MGEHEEHAIIFQRGSCEEVDTAVEVALKFLSICSIHVVNPLDQQIIEALNLVGCPGTRPSNRSNLYPHPDQSRCDGYHLSPAEHL